MKKIIIHLIFFPILYKAVMSWKKSLELNNFYAEQGCFEGPYSYSALLHYECDAGKRKSLSLYRLYSKKIVLSLQSKTNDNGKRIF